MHVLTEICPKKFFDRYFNWFVSGKFFFPPVFECLGKNIGQKIFLLQGIIGFRRAILADTPLIKRG